MANERFTEIIDDFSGGKVTYKSPLDLQKNEFQEFKELTNIKGGRAEKAVGETDLTAKLQRSGTTDSIVINGNGFFSYRTDWDGASPPVNVSTLWYIVFRYHILGTDHTFDRYDSSDLLAGSWVEIGLNENTWTGTSEPDIDMFEHNQVLRISDGDFIGATNHKSQWYGMILRDIWGNSITYASSSKFKQPGQAVELKEWFLKVTDITPPTVVATKDAFDTDGLVNVANEVGICIHYPTSADKFLDDLEVETFKAEDKYTVTFVYDFVQESALGQTSGGDIGIRSLEDVKQSGKRIPGIQVVPRTTDWNKRITAIRLWWQPQDNVDWYLVTTLDIDKGWSKNPKALLLSAKPEGGAAAENMGYWIPCPSMASLRLTDPGASITSGDLNTWNTGTDISAIQVGDIAWAKFDNVVKITDARTLIGVVASLAGGPPVTNIDLTYNPIDYSDTTSGNPVNKYLNAAAAHANKVATWYIPNDGISAFTYSSFTGGRSQLFRIPPIRWNHAIVVNDRAIYLNIDTEDQNEQTIRERSRIYWTDPYQIDVVDVTQYKDFGREDGDKGVGLAYYAGFLYVFKERSVYMVEFDAGPQERWGKVKHIPGFGANSKYTIQVTPFGVVAADPMQIYLLRPDLPEPIELSFKIRDNWRGKTFNNPASGYSPKRKQYMILADTSSASDKIAQVYDFRTKSWHDDSMTVDKNITNFQLGLNFEPTFAAQKDVDNV